LNSFAWVLLGLYWALLAIAAIQDIRSLRIANWVVLATLGASIALLLFVRDPVVVWQHLASFAIMLGIGILLFSLGWVGGGDAKLAAGAAALFTLGELLRFALATAIAGGVATILLIVVRLAWQGKGERKWLVARKGAGIPYGVPIALAAAWVAWTAVVPESSSSVLERVTTRQLPG
jgi:prepilin peptidase CpaA